MGALAYDSGFPAARVPDALCKRQDTCAIEGFRDVCGRSMLPVINGAQMAGKVRSERLKRAWRNW
ncbi:hypothetical protein HYPDE_28728 [Hyphomicrobium denitrificans 1NES1]|uniref:Uncharacterized protein n=1 Tax=Hyphomicrobium denitrificans 1NES1 TaxID=670307 RepID=N0BBC7_9HYPH|nr:hypothetical protein HYPDE_28728 [Hyphomicrobium denitrificans 1NES1]